MDGRWDDVVAVPTAMGDVGDPGQLVSSVAVLADGRAALLGWRSVATSAPEKLGPTVQATSEFARCLLAARTAAGGAVTGGGDVLFRLELPTGKALSDLVPAVGGGLRGVVRGADGRFAGQVRLMPAAAGVSGVAAGVALGVGALAVGAQMYYQAQLTATLAQIHRSGATVEQHLLHEMTARVDAAEEGAMIETCG